MHPKFQDKIWLKKVLIPFWFIELLWCLVTTIVSAIILASEFRTENPILWDAIFWLPFSATTLILDVTAIILYAKRNLQPVTYLVFQCVKWPLWGFIFINNILAATYYASQTDLAFLFSIVLFLTSTGQLAYASVIMDRKRKGRFERIRDIETTSPPASAAGNRTGSIPLEPQSRSGAADRGTLPEAGTSSWSSRAAPPPSYDPVEDGGRAPPSLSGKSGANYYTSEAAQESYDLQGVAYRGQQ